MLAKNTLKYNYTLFLFYDKTSLSDGLLRYTPLLSPRTPGIIIFYNFQNKMREFFYRKSAKFVFINELEHKNGCQHQIFLLVSHFPGTDRP
jgi:hypothetical protein